MSQPQRRPQPQRLIRRPVRPVRPVYYQPQSSSSIGFIIAIVIFLVLLVLAGDYIYVTSNYIPPQVAPLFQAMTMSQKIQFYYGMRVNLIKSAFGY